MLFGKNSDRQRNEAQAVEYIERRDHDSDAQVACTYVTIPQARRTNAVLLCRPFWMWGAEMGANEHGVVIGNEGLHARSPAPQEEALTGMDLLRLALERANTAEAAVTVITALLERHGQGGNCGHLTRAYYNNGFLIADPTEAFVVETVGREWLVERVRSVRSISNTYSIGRAAHSTSPGLSTLIRDSAWSTDVGLNYAEVLRDPDREHIGNAGARQTCSTALLSSREGELCAADLMSILRDHGSGERFHPEWQEECVTKRTICMHAGTDDRPGQTVGSMVSELHREHAVHWVTATAAPCISIFKPVLMGAALPAHGPRLTDELDANTLWWCHEQLHRAAQNRDFGNILDGIRLERDALEATFRDRVTSAMNVGDTALCTQVVSQCWSDASEMEMRWSERVDALPVSERSAHTAAWDRMTRLAGSKKYNGSTAIP